MSKPAVNPTLESIDHFKLAPHSYVLAMSQLDQDHDGLKEHMFLVSNDGTVPIEVEIVPEGDKELSQPLIVQVDPNETQPIARSPELTNTVLKVINKNDEEAVFSARGGKILSEDLMSTVQKITEK
ncbi:unnamed protein product [Psylliodes chrysocephalus]|uniref:Uncharacterized protein n=1 Tax=Psylliodes chrysocephalus TaxID=3402493 RepID=A0A9P0GL05_9CUCU|nr:unnamed protein product [Psylliodes chrysocephala]